MNAKKCKALRAHAGNLRAPRLYEQMQIHHLAEMPAWETYERVIHEMGPKGKVVSRTETRIRRMMDGRTPAAPVLGPYTDPETKIVTQRQRVELVPVAKPIRLKKGSPRAVYKLMKRIEGKMGLGVALQRLQEAA